jgi:hypothetical protein
MDLDHDACYRAIVQRDARFDGRFFTGVKTTGIYCRPVCPARTPHSHNVVFFPTAAAAQQAGFRPCLRCRPETAPDLGAWRGTSNSVSRALNLIELGALDEDDVDTLAGRLGLGERQLRRNFMRSIGYLLAPACLRFVFGEECRDHRTDRDRATRRRRTCLSKYARSCALKTNGAIGLAAHTCIRHKRSPFAAKSAPL